MRLLDRPSADGFDHPSAVRQALRLLFAASFLVIGIFAAAWGGVELAASGRIHYGLDDLKPADAGFVLGTSPHLRGGYPNPYFDNRIAAAAQLFAAGKVRYLVVSGNQATGYDEPTAMREALIAAGVPPERIYRDYAGFRTLDSVLRANRVFEQTRAIFVSQPFHLARALFLARSRGFDFEGYAADDVPLRYDIQTKFREVGARVWAFMDVVVDRAARFGGKPIVLGVDAPT